MDPTFEEKFSYFIIAELKRRGLKQQEIDDFEHTFSEEHDFVEITDKVDEYVLEYAKKIKEQHLERIAEEI